MKRITEIHCVTEILEEKHSVLVRLENDQPAVILVALKRIVAAGLCPELVHIRLFGKGQKNTEFHPNWIGEIRATGVELRVSIE